MAYVVTAPYVQALTGTADGPRVTGFYAGSVLPADVPGAWIERLLREGKVRRA